jgi:hypothetical protein
MRRASKQEDGAARTIRERLHGRVPAHAIKATHALVGGVTGIDFGEFDVGAGGGKSVARGEPSRLHVLAVAAPAASITQCVGVRAELRLPRCVELDDETRVDSNGICKLLRRFEHQNFGVGGSQAEESQQGKSEL